MRVSEQYLYFLEDALATRAGFRRGGGQSGAFVQDLAHSRASRLKCP